MVPILINEYVYDPRHDLKFCTNLTHTSCENQQDRCLISGHTTQNTGWNSKVWTLTVWWVWCLLETRSTLCLNFPTCPASTSEILSNRKSFKHVSLRHTHTQNSRTCYRITRLKYTWTKWKSCKWAPGFFAWGIDGQEAKCARQDDRKGTCHTLRVKWDRKVGYCGQSLMCKVHCYCSMTFS